MTDAALLYAGTPFFVFSVIFLILSKGFIWDI